MKIQRGAFSLLALLGLGAGDGARAAIKVHEDQAVLLGGASLPPGRGAGSAPEGPSRATAARAFDGLNYTTWQASIVEGGTCWLEYRFDDGVAWLVTEYTLTNGANGVERDPAEWELQGSLDGASWVTVDTKKRESFPGRRSTRAYRVRAGEAFNRYRLVFPALGTKTDVEIAELGFTLKAHVMPPTEVAAHAERGATVLNWQPVESATGYTVRRSNERLGTYTLVASGVQQMRYEDKGPFEDGELSYYTVSSELKSVQGAMSIPISIPTPVAPPSGLVARQGKGQVVLQWQPSPKALAYIVRRSLAREGPYTMIGSQITAPGYTDDGLGTGTVYHYVVCGVANGKEGIDSVPVSVSFPPDVPTGLTAEPVQEAITLKWNAVALATSYKIRRATSPEGAKEVVAVVRGDTVFTDKELSFKQTYHYTVESINIAGVSGESTPVSETPIRPPSWWRR